MMSRSTTTVVGAGIAGITAAYFELKKGRNVILLESDSRPGGLLKSDFHLDHYFDYGTHIYAQTGVSALDEFLFSDIDQRNYVIHKILFNANYFRGVMNSNSGYVDTSKLPPNDYYRACVELLTTPDNSAKAENLSEYLKQRFGETLYKNIFNDVVRKYFGVDAEKLSASTSIHFDMFRVLAFDDLTTKRLIQIDEYNSKLGHHERVEGVNKYYPKVGGTGDLICNLMNKLHQHKVDYRSSRKITKIQEKEGTVYEIDTETEKIQTDRLIWTLPSSLLVRLAGGKQEFSAPPIFRNTGIFDFVFQNPLNSNAMYINVYEKNFLSGRITLYQNMTKSEIYSCTVEVLADDSVDLSTKDQQILNELIQMELVDSGEKCVFNQIRKVRNGFPVLTVESVKGYYHTQEFCDAYFKNVVFLGRSPNRFFMSDILVNTHEKIVSQD